MATVVSIAQWNVKNQPMYCYMVTSLLTTCTSRWGATATHTLGHVINAPKPSLFSPTSCIIQIWDMANFCFNFLHFDSVGFMSRRRTGKEEHSVRIFGVHSF